MQNAILIIENKHDKRKSYDQFKDCIQSLDIHGVKLTTSGWPTYAFYLTTESDDKEIFNDLISKLRKILGEDSYVFVFHTDSPMYCKGYGNPSVVDIYKGFRDKMFQSKELIIDN